MTGENDSVEGWKSMRYVANEEDVIWVKKGVMRKVHNIDEVSMLEQKSMDVGILSLEVILIEGNKVFIKV